MEPVPVRGSRGSTRGTGPPVPYLSLVCSPHSEVRKCWEDGAAGVGSRLNATSAPPSVLTGPSTVTIIVSTTPSPVTGPRTGLGTEPTRSMSPRVPVGAEQVPGSSPSSPVCGGTFPSFSLVSVFLSHVVPGPVRVPRGTGEETGVGDNDVWEPLRPWWSVVALRVAPSGRRPPTVFCRPRPRCPVRSTQGLLPNSVLAYGVDHPTLSPRQPSES